MVAGRVAAAYCCYLIVTSLTRKRRLGCIAVHRQQLTIPRLITGNYFLISHLLCANFSNMNTFKAFQIGESPFLLPLEDRILHKYKKHGWRALAERVANLANQAEKMRDDLDSSAYLTKLESALLNGQMLPNSPLLVNAAEDKQRIFACFSVNVCEPIGKVLETFQFIHDGMGGVGYAVSGHDLDFPEMIRLIDDDTVRHQTGRPRPASNAVTMPISGNLEKFLTLAGTLSVTNMNVALDDVFMSDVNNETPSRQKLLSVAQSIHATGQPGIIFPDRIPRIAKVKNPVIAANVCGEAPLAADESALLASLNLTAFCVADEVGNLSFDEARFAECVKLSVRFLDGMHDLHCHANDELKGNTSATRKIGVGIMGFAHVLMLLGMRYGDDACLAFAERVSLVLMTSARQESVRLAHQLGAYPAWHAEHGEFRRNASLVAIAGTATIALIAGTSCGVEPIFSPIWNQKIIGQHIRILDPVVSFILERAGLDVEQAKERLLSGESLTAIAGHALASLMPSAVDIPGDVHIRVQAALQTHIDGGITKTVNCENNTTVDQISDWIQQAHQSGCVGLMIYRNQSLADQPMLSN